MLSRISEVFSQPMVWMASSVYTIIDSPGGMLLMWFAVNYAIGYTEIGGNCNPTADA